jgi:predicted XRE-type DNA-binding protein
VRAFPDAVRQEAGRIQKFSLDALANLAARAGLDLRIEVTRPAA